MSKQKNIPITIFQAPYASLIERGLYLKMHDPDHPFHETVPAEYYLPVFNGEIECPQRLLENRERQTYAILEHIYTIFNTVRPTGYCGRSLSAGDMVKLEGNYYLCATLGFHQVVFQASQNHPSENPTACPLALPDGTALRVKICKDESYPGINIDLVAADGTENRVCLAEYNPEKVPGHELCIGVYCDSEDDTVYYDSYCKESSHERNQ